MAFDTTIFAQDIRSAINDLPVSFTFLGTSISGSFTDMSSDNQLMMYGVDEAITLQIIGMKSDFAITPTPGKTIVYNNVQYRIIQVVDTADQVSWTINCTEHTKSR